jgi:hypothetical protein
MWTSVGTLVSLWFFIQLSAAAKVGGAAIAARECRLGIREVREMCFEEGTYSPMGPEDSRETAKRPITMLLQRRTMENCSLGVTTIARHVIQPSLQPAVTSCSVSNSDGVLLNLPERKSSRPF